MMVSKLTVVIVTLFAACFGFFSQAKTPVFANENPVIEQTDYQVVGYKIQPILVLQIYSGCQCQKQLRVSVDTYERGYYIAASSHPVTITNRQHVSLKMLPFTKPDQTYDLVLRLWQEKRAIQNYVFSLFSASEQTALIREENAFIQQPIRIIQDEFNHVITYYQSVDFRPVFLQQTQTMPTIDVSRFYFQYLGERPFVYETATLYIEDGFLDSDIAKTEKGYAFPLLIVRQHGFYFFRLQENYYFDHQQGVMKLSANENTLATNRLVLSFQQSLAQIHGHIAIEKLGGHLTTYLIDFTFRFQYQLFGKCEDALICIRKQTPLQNVNYTHYLKAR